MKLKPLKIPFSMFSTRNAELCNQSQLILANERFYHHLKKKSNGQSYSTLSIQRKNRPNKHKMIGEVG